MKKNTAISTTDILIINKVIFPNSALIVVYGASEKNNLLPEKNVIFIQEEAELDHFLTGIKRSFTIVNFAPSLNIDPEAHRLMEGMLDFSNEKKSSNQQYLFINNPDGTVRWFFPKTNKTPCYLNLYNGSGWKANLFEMASKTLSKVKRLHIISDGQFSVIQKKDTTFNINFPMESYDDFAVFTGTVGENRKAIIALSKNGTASQFIKIPLTDASAELVKNEFLQLSDLGNSSFQTIVLPKVKFKDSQIMVSNVLPVNKKGSQDWSTTHWKSLEELYTNSYQKNSLVNTPFWNTIIDKFRLLQGPHSFNNGLEGKEIFKLKKLAEQVFDELDPNEILPLGVGHGDFTPWNMYVNGKKLHVYDWEMSQPDYPLLFDVFHYFFQKGILIQKANYDTIWQDIQTELESKEAQQVLSKFDINQEKHLQLYLLYIVCYYLPKYISQPKLHDQVHWLIATWTAAFQSITGKKEASLIN